MGLDKSKFNEGIEPVANVKKSGKLKAITLTEDQQKKQALALILQKDIDRILLEKVLNNNDLSIKMVINVGDYSKYVYNETNKKFEPLNKDNLSFLVNKKMSMTLDGSLIEYNPLALRTLYDNVCNTSKIEDENIIKSEDSLNVIGLKNGYLIYKNNRLVFEKKLKGKARKFYINYIDRNFDPDILKKPNLKMSKYFFELMNKDATMTDYLLKVLSSIFIPNNILQKFFVFIGRGGNGKNVLEETIKNILGSENFSNMSPNDLKRDDYIIKLSSTLINWTPDLHGGFIEASDKLKAISSGDSVEGRALYSKSISIKMNTKIFINSNKQLNLDSKSEDGGIRRRIVVVPFTKTYSNKERDNFNLNRKEHFSDKNANWLFNYLIEYANKVLEQGVSKVFDVENSPQKVRDMYGSFLENTNYLIDFMEEVKPLIIEEIDNEFFVGLVWTDKQGAIKISFENLYNLYVYYCKRGAFKPLNIRNFIEKILEEDWFERNKKPQAVPKIDQQDFIEKRYDNYGLDKTNREMVHGKASRQTGYVNDCLLNNGEKV